MASVHYRRTVRPARLTKESLGQLLELATRELDSAETHNVSVELEVESGDAKVNAEDIDDLFLEIRPFSDLTAVKIQVRSWRKTPHVLEKNLLVRLGSWHNEVSSESTNADWASATTNRLADYINSKRMWYWRLAGINIVTLPFFGSCVAIIAAVIAAKYGEALMARMFVVGWAVLGLSSVLLVWIHEKLVPRFKVYLDQSGRSDNLATIGIALAVFSFIMAPFLGLFL